MIHTVNSAKELINTIDPITEDDLVLFSLDNVILENHRQYGSAEHHAELKRILSESEVVKTFSKAQEIADISLPELETKNVIESLKNRGITVIGITSRNYKHTVNITNKQLNDVSVSFSCNELKLDDVDKRVYLNNGVLYSNGSNKLDAIELYSKAVELSPKKIVFIAASLTALEELKEYEELNYVGVNYDYLSWKVKNFDLAVADLQREHHVVSNTVLNDRDAYRILNQRHSH